MATSRTPTRGPGSSYNLTPSPPPQRTQYTFSTQRAVFTKPVPAALLPIYPNFAQDLNSSDAEDEASIVNMLTESMATPQGRKDDPSAADWNSQMGYRNVDTMATVRQAVLVRGFAEKTGISPTSISTNLSLNTADFDRSPGKIGNMEVQPEIHSNSVMARFASFLGLKDRRGRQLDKSASNSSVSLMDASPPSASPFKYPKNSPLPSSLRSDFLKPSSSLSSSNSLCAGDDRNTIMHAVIEDDRERVQLEPLGQAKKSKRRKHGRDSSCTTCPHQPKKFPRHLRSRSFDIGAHLQASNQASLIPFAEVPPPHSRSRSMDVVLSRYGHNNFMDPSLRVSSFHAPPVIVPPNCVLIQVWAVGLDENDRRLVVGSHGCVIDGVHNFKSSQEILPDRRRAKRREEETSDQQMTQKYNGKRIAREVSLPMTPELLEAECFPGQSFVGRVLGVGSVVKKSFAARDDWVVGLVDIRKVSLLSLSSLKLQSVDKGLVWRLG